jgi:hypothetical protein
LFISIRMGASVSQDLALISLPRGALISRTLALGEAVITLSFNFLHICIDK